MMLLLSVSSLLFRQHHHRLGVTGLLGSHPMVQVSALEAPPRPDTLCFDSHDLPHDFHLYHI